MSQRPLRPTWPGWSVITASHPSAFTLWCTGLAGTGKTTLATLVQQALVTRGYKVAIIDRHSLTSWLQQEMQVEEQIPSDQSHTLGFDAFITHICGLLTRNGVVTITTSVSPYQAARRHAREQLPKFIEIYLTCNAAQRYERLRRLEHVPSMNEEYYQPPQQAELHITTDSEPPEHSALRVIEYLEEHGYIAPLWQEKKDDPLDPDNEETERIKARLRALGYLE
jgi:adenylylsulfate kinase